MMFTNDENSSATKLGKRRSSILKMSKSPGLALDDIDPNVQNSDDATDVKSKKSRRSASRRVSFAETCQIKEIPNEALKRAQFEIDENTSAHLVLELANTHDESTYREPAMTLAGLSSLLSSPIQDSPSEKQRFRELHADERCSDGADMTTSLDFTCVGFSADTSVNQLNTIANPMDMTIHTGRLIHEDVQNDQTTEMSFYQAELTPKNTHRQPLQKLNRSPEEGDNLDFTQCQGSNYIQDIHDKVADQDDTSNQMEISRNWEFGKVVGTPHPTLRVQSEQRSPEQVDDLDFTCDGDITHGMINADMTSIRMEMTRNYDQAWELQKSNMPTPHSRTSGININEKISLQRSGRSPEQGNNLDLTQCGAGNIADIQCEPVDEDITGNQMEMTMNYDEQWEKSSFPTPHSTTPRANNEQALQCPERSPEEGESLDLTCQGNVIQKYGMSDEATTSNQMEMRGNYQVGELGKSCMVIPHSTISRVDNNRNVGDGSGHSAEGGDNLDFTCHGINIDDGQDVTGNQMEMTRNYEEWDSSHSTTSKENNIQSVQRPQVILPRTIVLERPFFKKVECPKINPLAFLNELRTGRKILTKDTKSVLRDRNAPKTDKAHVQGTLPSSSRGEGLLFEKLESPRMNGSDFLNKLRANAVSMGDNTIKRPAFLNDSRASDAEIVSVEDSKCDSSSRDVATTSCQSQIVDYQDAELPKLECPKLNGSAYVNELQASDTKVVSLEDSQVDCLSAQDMPTTRCQSDIVNCQDIEMKEAQVPGIVLTPCTVDLMQSQIIPAPKKNLSMIAEESAVEQSINQNQDEKPKESENDKKADVDKKPYTYKEFRSKGNLFFLHHVSKRSEPRIIKDAEPSQMKDIIYQKCLREGKFDIWYNNWEPLRAEITTNEKLLSLRKEELSKSNPEIFEELERAVAMGTQDSVENKMLSLKSGCHFSIFSEWYGRQAEIEKEVLSSLKKQKEILSNNVSLLQNDENVLDGDDLELEKLNTELEKKIQDLQNLDSDEKEWDAYKEKTDECKRQSEGFELELHAKESQREYLASEKDAVSCHIAAQKKKKTELENNIQKENEEMAYADLNLKEMKKNLPCLEGLQEWILTEHDANSMKFTFLCNTFDLEVSFEEQQDSNLPAKTKRISLISQLSDNSIPLAKLAHQLIVQKFSQNDFLAMFPTRGRLPQLLHLVSEAIARARALIEDMQTISINHIVLLNGKILTIEFSSLAKFIKFELNFDLNELVTDGALPYAVVRKIGTTSSDAIAKQLSHIPPTIICLPKIVEAADEFLS